MEMMGVKIGDKFKNGKYNICQVVDFYEVKSTITGNIIEYKCIAIVINSDFGRNRFDIPFSMVIRNKVK